MRPVWAEIDLTAISHNIGVLRRLARPGALFMAVVKANAYGHGAIPVAQEAIAAGADRLGVATIEEAVQLAQAGITVPIQILSEIPADTADLCAALDHGFILTVCRRETATALSKSAVASGKIAKTHVKVDTGMNRLGISADPTDAVEFVKDLLALPSLDVEGIFTHFATADDPESDFSRTQLTRFTKVLDALGEQGICPPVRHAANSAAIIDFPESHLDMVRAGIAVYGLNPSAAFAGRADLKPSLSLKTKVTFVKDVPAGEGISYGLTYMTVRPGKIATLPLGYADGYSRMLSNKTAVLINGTRAPNVGTICMDQFMVDVSDIQGVEPGAETVLIGQQGQARITADDIAAALGTINYEVVCLIGARVPRVYIS
jgi:alanine racemase